MSAATVSALSESSRELELYRDDGALAAAVGVTAGRLVALPAIALLLAADVALFAAIAVTGQGAPRGVVAGVIALVVVLGGLASGRAVGAKLRWAVPPALRALELGAVLWIAAVAGASSLPAAFAALCAIAYRHYDVVYGLRYRGTAAPRWVQATGGGWDGRMLVALVLLLAGALPAGLYVMAGALGVLFAGETIAEWRRVGGAGRAAHDDAEGEAG
jgi:hypothetical protein